MTNGFRALLASMAARPRRLLGALGVALGLVILTPIAAYAYFTYTDSSNANPAAAEAGTLSAPTTPNASASGTTITIGWALPVSQLSGAQYRVTRTSGPGSPHTVCTVSASTTSCPDAGLADGTYGYSIMAVLQNWQSSAITASATVASATTVSQTSPGTYTLSVPAGVTSFDFAVNGGGGGGGDNGSGSTGSAGASGGAIEGTVTIPSSASATNFTVVVGGGGGRGNGGTGGTGGAAGTGCAAGGNGGTNGSGAGGGGGGGSTCIYPSSAPNAKVVVAGGGGGGGGFGSNGIGGGGGGVTTNPGSSFGIDGGNGSGSNGANGGSTVTSGAASPFTVTANTGGASGGSGGATTPSCTLTGCNNGGNGGGGGLSGNGGGGGGGMASGGGGGSTFIANGGGGGGGSAYAGGTAGATVAVTFASDGGAANGGGSETAGTAGSADFTGSGLTLVGTPTKLAFTQQPNGGTSGAIWTTQPQVSIQDAGNTTVPGTTNPITLAIATQPGSGAVLSCATNPLPAVNGVANFSGCSIAGTPGNYTISASAGGLTGATSSTFTITVGAPDKLVFAQQPAGATGGSPFTTQPKVAVQDSTGNVVTTYSSTITLSILGGTPTSGGPGTLSGCTQIWSAGVATFSGCEIDIVGTGYKLHAVDGGLTPADSIAFNVAVGAPAQVTFTQQPSLTSTGGVPFAQQPQVTVKDAGGNLISSSPVTLSVTAGSGGGAGGTVSCTTNPLNTNGSGVATFAGCSINTASLVPYTLSATAGSATAVSSNILISVGPASKLTFTQQPSSGTGGTPFATQPKVAVTDAGGNVITTDVSTVTLSITPSTPTSGGPGALTGCSSTQAAGVTTFSGCKINTPGTNYRLRATNGVVTNADSNQFNITLGAPADVTFTQQPSSIATGSTAFATQPQVTVKDAGGNLLTGSPVILSITSGSGGGAPGTLACTNNTVNTNGSGVAVFAGCLISTGSGTPYTLTATDASATAVSTGVTVSTVANGLTPTSGGVGSSATITALGFAPSQALSVTVGGTSATITSGGTSTSTGSSNITFTIPSGAPGAKTVVVSDGTRNATSATNFTVSAISLVSMSMQDVNNNGKVDRVVATFSTTLQSSSNTAQWTLANVPSNGTLASVSTSGTNATLFITEGAGAANTAVGTFTLALAASPTGIRDSGGNQASFSATAPSDGAKPVPTQILLSNSSGGNNENLNNGDIITITYSEAMKVSTMCSGWATDTSNQSQTGVAIVMDNDPETFAIPSPCANIGTPADNLVDTDVNYLTGSPRTFTNSTLAYNATTRVLVITLSGSTTGGTLNSSNQDAARASYTPTTGLTDPAGNAMNATRFDSPTNSNF